MTTTRNIQEKIMFIRKQIENQSKEIEQAKKDLYEEKQRMKNMVKLYAQERVELVKQELIAREMTWCTYCCEAVPKKGVRLLFIEGRTRYSHGYEGSCYGFCNFSKLHQVCPSCRKSFENKHGEKSEYDSQAKDQTSFYAFRISKRKDGYYAYKFGNWAKIEEKDCKIKDPSNDLIEKLAKEYGLPPKIEYGITLSDNHEESLVIHEPALSARAS
jgi:hypothetical protein